jgi:NAD(P)-dependent dehydrogenase (short-subunit alcohol dehydrogenase family)
MPKSDSRLILITGVTKGLGRSLALGMAALGHTIVGCGRSAPQIESLAAELREPHSFSPLDVTNDAEVQTWAAQILKKYGPPDFLINNAAVINKNAPLWQVPAEEFNAVIDVNLKGIANIIRAFVPEMVRRGSGVIVNLSSGWGRSTSPEVAPYCASKWGVEGLSLALAQELPQGMASIPLNPGIINTEMLQSCFGGSADRFPDADEWSTRAIPFILSLTSDHNGTQLTVPGSE